MGSKIEQWLEELSTKRATYDVFFLLSLVTLALFSILLRNWFGSSPDANNSRMELVLLFPLIASCFILLLMSALSLFYYLPKRKRINRASLSAMFLLAIPDILLGIFCIMGLS